MKDDCRGEIWQPSLLRSGKYLKSMKESKNKMKIKYK